MDIIKRIAVAMLISMATPGFTQSLFSDGFEDSAPVLSDTAKAVSFLSHATFGPTGEDINAILLNDYSAWIDVQIALPATLHLPQVEAFLPNPVGQDQRQRVWWDVVLKADDQLRQRVAFALSEILVVSERTGDLASQPIALADYYDVLVRHAFGNYRELLEEVTLTPVMGHYLSMFRSTRDTYAGTESDENYAREIMQLFTIGLVELNLDGSVKTDGAGQPIPTYNQTHIIGLAEAFTGWNFVGTEGPDGDCKTWERRYPPQYWLQPLAQCPVVNPEPNQPSNYHVTTAKTIVGDVIIPANQTAMQDLTMALDTLFNHPNVGSFLARRLIQRMVTSNPTPAYISWVATVFNNDGSGERGNLGAVVRAILIDPEVTGSATAPAHAGKLREPLLRVTHLYRVYDAQLDTGCFDSPETCWPGAVYSPDYFFGQAACTIGIQFFQT